MTCVIFIALAAFGLVEVAALAEAPIRRQSTGRQLADSRVRKEESPSEEDAATNKVLEDVLSIQRKPWFNATARHMVRDMVAKTGTKIWGESWKQIIKGQFMVIDELLTESECAQMKDEMDRREAIHWKNSQETAGFVKFGESKKTKDEFVLFSADFVGDGLKCVNGFDSTSPDDRGTQLFLKIRQKIVSATRSYFPEGSMIHPEHTTAQRRSRPMTNTTSNVWNIEHNIHMGVHADNCQNAYLDTEDSYCSSLSNNGFTQRSHTAVVYLNGYGENQGGELFFSKLSSVAPPMDKRQTIPLKCGRLVVFESGPLSLHGVNAFKSGSRHVLDLWMTTIAGHYEREHHDGLRKCTPWEDNEYPQ